MNQPNPRANEVLPWLRKTTDDGMAIIPVLTDQIASSGGDTNLLHAGAGHQLNNKIVGANLLMGDGHVETRAAAKIQWRWIGGANYVAFY